MSLASPRKFLPPPWSSDTTPKSPSRAVLWDGITYPPPAGTIGPWSVAINAAKLFQWQCRMGYWDWEWKWVDSFGLNPDIIRNYGDTPPTDNFPAWLSRELNVYSSQFGEQVPIGGMGFLGGIFEIIMQCLTLDGILFNPNLGVTFGSTALQDNTGTLYFPALSVIPQAATWTTFGNIGIDDQAGFALPLPIYVQPTSDFTSHPLQSYYTLNYWNIKPTVFISS